MEALGTAQSPHSRTDVPADGRYHTNPLDATNLIKHIRPWYPPGVTETDVLWGGNTAKVALLADGTALKYVWDRDDDRAKRCMKIEHEILLVLGSHERIVRYLGKHDYGLRFKYAANGDLRRYLASHDPSIETRKKWSLQAAEGLAFIHSKNVIHSDFHPSNLLLDKQLNLQLCDFAGSVCGELDGAGLESARYFRPRNPTDKPDEQSDMFALGSTLYFIMSNKEPYADLLEHEITARFSANLFPEVQKYFDQPVIEKCWGGGYKNAEDVVHAIRNTQL